MRPRLSLLALLALAVLLPAPSSADPSPLRPRFTPDKRTHARLPEATRVDAVVVKFHEGTAVRLRNGQLAAQERSERDRRDLRARGLAPAAVERDAAEVQRLAGLSPDAERGLQRVFSLPEETLAQRRERGEARSGRQLADLALYYELPLAPGAEAGDVTALLDALNALPSVEIAYARPPAEPASLPLSKPAAAVSLPEDPTPSFQDLQGYLNAAPQGVDAFYAWTQPGGRGQGIKVVDIEGGWQTTHEDMPPLFFTGGEQFDSPYYRNHGTAVLGVIAGLSNGFGMTGIAHEAQAGYQSVFPSAVVADAIVKAAEAVEGGPGIGGVVLIELHVPGPATSWSCACNPGQCHFIPMEYEQAVFDAIADATANGMVVVEAGGNGSTNLDDPVYGGLFDRNVRDSGAILVAASNSTDRGAPCWTNWGSRFDLHGWGDTVATLGYGNLYNGGTEDRWYTGWFNGTSSASPIVTGAVASLQGRALATLSATLDPLVLRDLLKTTGTPQIGEKNIGPLPDLRAAFETLDAYQTPLDFYTVMPCRVVDTPQLGAPLHSGDPYGFAIAGRCGVPATARAVALNITAVSATANGHLALWPRHLTKPQTSSVNFSAGQTRAGNGILLLSPDGEIAVQSFLTDGGAVHLLLDVAGYFE